MSDDSRLTTWALDHTETKDYSDYFWDQVRFVRDEVSSLLSRTYKEYRDLTDVVSTHRSKSCTLPVFFIDLPKDGVKIWMRYNFYNWNVSVESDRPLTCDFLHTFSIESGLSYCYCEGMEDKKFESYKDNNKKFTVCIGNKYDVYVFLSVLRKFLGIKKEE